jgi:hypothetical protein
MRQRWLRFVAGSIVGTMLLLPVGAATTPATAQRSNDTRDECIRDGGAWQAVVGVCVFGASALSPDTRRYDLARLEASEPAHSQLAKAESQRRRDINECVRASIGAEDRGGLFAVIPINRQQFKQCMEARGYTD